MKRYILSLMLLLPGAILFSQNERKVIRQGVKQYQDGKFSQAEVQFRKAQDLEKYSFEAAFNTGAAMYGQEKFQETYQHYETILANADDPGEMAHIWHNMGNSLLEAQQYPQSIEAYKNSLRINPHDQDTKYNLAYAKKKLQEQQQQDQDQEQEQQEEQQNQDQDQEQEQQEEQQNQDQQEEQQNQEQQEPEQANPQEISKEDAERMLDAIQQQEKEVKDKVDKKKAAVANVKTDKDW